MFEFFGDLIVGFFQFLAEIAIEGRRERRARERGAVVGLMRVQSGEASGLSPRWRSITAKVDPRRLSAEEIELHILGIPKPARPLRLSEQLSAVGPSSSTTAILELQTADAVIEWWIPAQDVQWVTCGLEFVVQS
ncbi:MAG: hypothetical protein FWD85_04990 [Microbacteriaceae bacterium]|nr:hypothetical protein [Microbacteriaceae bacterium]MCL2794646.1 hypothetical protein [Microbacteriaceae bacterium]